MAARTRGHSTSINELKSDNGEVLLKKQYDGLTFVSEESALTGATAIFGGGLAHMIDDSIPGTYNILYTLLVLTYSAFCLTSLDTATRLARFMFQELWLDGGETPETVTGYKKVLSNMYVATAITVAAGGADWGPYVQAIFGILLVVLAVILAIEGVVTIAKPKKKAA